METILLEICLPDWFFILICAVLAIAGLIITEISKD